VPYLAW